jgi:hypothetical protein
MLTLYVFLYLVCGTILTSQRSTMCDAVKYIQDAALRLKYKILNNDHQLYFQLTEYSLISHVFYLTLITMISTLIYVALTFYIVTPYARSIIRDLVIFCKHTILCNILLIQAWRWPNVRDETCSLGCNKNMFLTKWYKQSCVWPHILHIHFYFVL